MYNVRNYYSHKPLYTVANIQHLINTNNYFHYTHVANRANTILLFSMVCDQGRRSGFKSGGDGGPIYIYIYVCIFMYVYTI